MNEELSPALCGVFLFMAARIQKRHTEEIRARIQASTLLNRLHSIAMGEADATPAQVNAINSLLDRSVPKLQQIQHVGDEQQPMRMEFSWKSNKS